MRLFKNRNAAAMELARHLDYLRGERPLVLGLGHEGLPVAEIVATALGTDLDVLLLERLTAPDAPDQVVGVVDEFGRISMIESTARWHHLSSQQMIGPARAAFSRIQRRRARVRAILPPADPRGRTVIVVSEGVGTGAAMLGAIASVRDRGATRIVVAAPAGASSATWQLHEMAHQVVIPHRPSRFDGIETFYEDYTTVSDDLLLAILRRWTSTHPVAAPSVQTLVLKLTHEDGSLLGCEIDLPPGAAKGSGPYPAVIYAHGFESDARSPRSVPISRRLAKRGVVGVRLDFTGHGRSEGTLEDATHERMRADLALVHRCVTQLDEIDGARLGLCGSGTGALLALEHAAEHPEVRALVIRGPVCGGEVAAAAAVRAPTLLVHAERDTALRESVDRIDAALGTKHRLLCIPDSSRIFNDPISLELMIDASVDWLADHLLGSRPDEPAAVETVRRAERANAD